MFTSGVTSVESGLTSIQTYFCAKPRKTTFASISSQIIALEPLAPKCKIGRGRNCDPYPTARITMSTKNQERYDELQALAPIDAVRAWLNGEFGMGDEQAMITAIRRDTRISLSEDAIIATMFEAMTEGLDAPGCLERLAVSS